MWQKCWCGQNRNHGGDKKLAAEHSKQAQAKHAEEREKYPQLFIKPEKQYYPSSEPIAWKDGHAVKISG